MELVEAIRTRRSVKKFDPNHEMTDAEIRRLFELVALAPTSFNMQNWQFVAVRDAEQKARLCAAAWNQAQVRDASLVVVCAGDLEAHRRTDRYLRKAPEEVRSMFEPMISGFYEGKRDLLIQEACRSLGFAGMIMMLVARDMGLDSCPMIGFEPDKVADICGLDEDRPPLLMITIGKALEPARPRMGLLNLEEFVSLERYGNRGLTGEIPDA